MLNSALNERKPQSSIFSFDIRSGSLFFLDRKQKQSCFAEKFPIFLIIFFLILNAKPRSVQVPKIRNGFYSRSYLDHATEKQLRVSSWFDVTEELTNLGLFRNCWLNHGSLHHRQTCLLFRKPQTFNLPPFLFLFYFSQFFFSVFRRSPLPCWRV